jgi:Mce-associated membrane protein
VSVTTEKKHDPDTEEELDAAEVDVEDTTEDSTEDSADETADEQPTSRRWPRRVLIGSVIAIFIAALAGSGVLGWQLWQERQIDQAGEQAQRAAVAYAQVLTSIDANKVDENFAQVLDGSTGEFKDMYSQSSMQLRQLLIDNKATAHGVVVDSAVQFASKDKVVVLLFVDQSVSNTSVPDPRVDRSRIKMTMENVDDDWRASKVELP